MSEYKPVTVVDTDDNPLGGMSFSDALATRAIRRLAKVFIRRSSGELFLQKRSETIALYPGVLDQSAGGHVDWGDSYEETAHKELREELGIDTELYEIAYLYAEEKGIGNPSLYTWSKIYLGTYDGDLTYAPEEVAGGEWLLVAEIDERLRTDPDAFVPAFHEVWRVSRDALLS